MTDNEFSHYGVKGMRWGVRRSDRPEGVSRRVYRDAGKDAKEFARAKMFYGEGAGNRRKLIKGTVEGKSKRSEEYKKAFDAQLDRQDMSKHASRAKGERARRTAVKSTAKTARGVSHILRGNAQYASAAAAMLVGGAMYARRAGIDKVVVNAAKTAYSNVRNSTRVKAGMPASQFLKNMGL